MAYDAAHGQVVLFGGSGAGILGDTWVWDGSNWTEKTPSNNPSPRDAFATVYDSAHSQVVLFGGADSTGNSLNDTWVWDGTNWTQEFPDHSPSARNSFAMAYDSAHGQVVLFGGYVGFDGLNDTWVWDGSDWSQKAPENSPPARVNTAMAYDSAHAQVVLFSGFAGFFALNKVPSDTWVWDGVNWSQASPQDSPPGREYSAMAYDSAHKQVVLFGGAPAQGKPIADTWLWDGSNWTKASAPSSPTGREGHVMAYDSAHNQVVLFGGTGSVLFGDTWTWFGGAPAPPPPPPPAGPVVNGVVSASAFGGFSTVAPGSWIEIYGSDLAPDTRMWVGTDFQGNNAPTSLDGVEVTIGGEKAFVDYISTNPGQVNVQLPSNIPTGGTLPLTVTNGTATSAPFNVTVSAVQPGLLAPANFQISGNQYAVALLPDGSYVLPAGALPGVASRPAKPGETIVMYGIGFGAVIPDIPAGQVATVENQLSEQFAMMFGKTQAQLTYFGLAPGFVGLYQFNVVVPLVPDSDLVPLTFTLGGASGSQTLYTAVHE